MEYGILSLLVPLLTILVALVAKEVVSALLLGIFSGLFILHDYDFFAALKGLSDGVISTLSEEWVAKTILFSLLVGGLIALLERGGAVKGFIAYLHRYHRQIDSPIGGQAVAFILGITIFIESSVTALVAGTVARPLCDRNGVSREKLAYICDATSAPVCSLIPLNAWGALLLGLIATGIGAYALEGDAMSLLIASIPYNFYAIFALLLVAFVIFKGWDIGPMRQTEAIEGKYETQDEKPALWPMLLPMLTLIFSMPVFLYITGHGDLFKGSGSTSVYYATLSALLTTYGLFLARKTMTHRLFLETLFEGMGKMLPIGAVLLLAVFIGKVIGELDTAAYLAATLEGNLSAWVVPALVFCVSSLIAFATGTSWGTFSIMIPIALGLASSMELYAPLVVGAVVSGGIFGDHASPISDTTIVSSLASQCDPIEHARTQLPYALIGAALACAAFLISGYVTV